MTTPLVIIGCGGFGREVHDVVDAINDVNPTWKLLGYLDDGPEHGNVALVEARGWKVLGGTDWANTERRGVHFVIGIGAGKIRRTIDQRLTDAGLTAATLIHPSATLGYDVRIGPGSVVCAGVRATTNISLGRHVHIDQNAVVGHDCILGDFCRLNPQACISGAVTIGQEALIGANATVLQGLRVGSCAIVGAGSCVVRDVPSDAVVKGVPAR